MLENTALNAPVGAFLFPWHLVIPIIPLIISCILMRVAIYDYLTGCLSICVLYLFIQRMLIPSLCQMLQTSPLGLEDLVLCRLQPHVTQPAEMVTCCPLCCLSFSLLLDRMVILSSLAKTWITRTSSKNIMPVLDTGHLLACPRDILDTEERGEVRQRRRRREREGRELHAGIRGGGGC